MTDATIEPGHSVGTQGNSLLPVGIALQTLLWFYYYAPFLPLPPMSLSSVFLHVIPLSIGIVGLYFNAQTKGRHPAWSWLGVVPLLGPIGGLIALNMRSKPAVLSLDPPPTVSAIRPRSFTRSLARNILWFFAGVWIMSLGWTILLSQSITTSFSPDSSFRVHADCCGIHVQRIVGGIFLTEQAAYDGVVQRVHRIVWSKDGSRFFAIGSDSNCLPGITFPDFNGSSAYALVMYDSAFRYFGAFQRLCSQSPDVLKQYEWHNFSF